MSTGYNRYWGLYMLHTLLINSTYEVINFVSERKAFKFLAKDKNNQLVFLSDSSFSLEMTKQKFPTLKFHYKSEF